MTLRVALLAVGALGACAGQSPPVAHRAVGGSALVAARPYLIEVPAGYSAASPAPLLVELPGFMTEPREQEEYLKLGRVALAKGALLVLAPGTRSRDGYPFWNATDACCDLYRDGPDDVAYLDAVLDDVAARYAVDRRRVWLVGHSNGGFMAHRYACERASRVAGIVSLAGAGWLEPTRCKPAAPVAVLQIHGDADATIHLGGGSLAEPALVARWTKAGIKLPPQMHVAAYPSAAGSLAPWRLRGGCAGDPQTTPAALDLDEKLAGAETDVTRWPCREGAVELWTLHGGAHDPALTAAFPERVFAFLAAHPRP